MSKSGYIIGGLIAVGGVTALLVVLRPAGLRQTPKVSAGGAVGGYDYAVASSQPARQGIRAAEAQWPESPQQRMETMTARLDRVARKIGQAAGTHCVTRLGATDQGAVLNEDGTVTVDAATLWRVSEDALAGLIACEVAHASLGHARQFGKLKKDRESGLPGTSQRDRDLRMAADERAGQLVAGSGYRSDGYRDALRHTRLAGDANTDQRSAAFERGYNRVGTASQPVTE
jgi:hypothetical protein